MLQLSADALILLTLHNATSPISKFSFEHLKDAFTHILFHGEVESKPLDHQSSPFTSNFNPLCRMHKVSQSVQRPLRGWFFHMLVSISILLRGTKRARTWTDVSVSVICFTRKCGSYSGETIVLQIEAKD